MPSPRTSPPVRRITLEPIGRFAFLVVGIHALLAGLLWWWLSRTETPLAGSPASGQAVTWISPSDFTAPPKPVQPAPQPQETATSSPEPSPPMAAPTPPAPVPVPATSSPPAPAPTTVAAAEASGPAPVPVPMPAPAPKEKPQPPEENTHEVPKAIGLDPAQAAAIMAKARTAEEAASKAKAQAQAEPPSPEPKAPPPAPVPVQTASTPPAPPPPPPTPVPARSAPPAPETTAAAPPPPAQQAVQTSRFVTVSLKTRPKDTKTAPKTTSLLDIAALDAAGTGTTGAEAGVRLDAVDRAIIDSFMREWVPPDASTLRRDQRTAHLEMAVDRGGRVLTFKLIQPSGSIDLDMSVLEAADRLDKIGAQLPAGYPKERYEFQVNLHAE